MSGRPDLSLDAATRDAFLHEVLGDGTPVPCATPGADGYPVVRLVAATAGPDGLRLAEPPPPGVPVCVIVERGATYDDITAVVARGPVHGAVLALDDLVSFSFAPAGGAPR